MLEKDFDKRPVTPIVDDVFDRLGMHITSFGYLKDKFPWFIELLDSSIKEENK